LGALGSFFGRPRLGALSVICFFEYFSTSKEHYQVNRCVN